MDLPHDTTHALAGPFTEQVRGTWGLPLAEKRAQETEGTPSYIWREVMHLSEQDVMNQEEPVPETSSKKTNPASSTGPVHPTLQEKRSQNAQAG